MGWRHGRRVYSSLIPLIVILIGSEMLLSDWGSFSEFLKPRTITAKEASEDGWKQENGAGTRITEIFFRKMDDKKAVDGHLFFDGINHSSRLKMVNNASRFLPDDQTVWVLILGNKKSIAVECERFGSLIKDALEERQKQGVSGYGWNVYIIAYRDAPVILSCPEIEAAMNLTGRTIDDDGYDTGSIVLHYAQRSIVKARTWDKTIQWIKTGEIIPAYQTNATRTKRAIGAINTGTGSENILRHHLNYPVRSDTVEYMSKQTKRLCAGSSLSDPIESSCDRSLDVAHFWPSFVLNKGAGLRDRVSKVLIDDYCATNVFDSDTTANPTANTTAPTITTDTDEARPLCFIGIAGKRAKKGRNSVSTDYVDTLLKSKIVVVSQRNNWEGHWRLMEALVSGAMVMTDKMLSLPFGYQDGVSVVEYESSEDLLRKVAYYTDPTHASERLSVAREGRRLAMEGFRSWHVMEKLILGKIVTTSGFRVYP